MNFDLSIPIQAKLFENEVSRLKALQKIATLKEVKSTRSLKQNAALHLFFTMISSQLNELGMEFTYDGLKGKEISLKYTPELVKNFFWRPIQMALFEFESTTKLTTEEINTILDIIVKFFAEKEVMIEFPSFESLTNK